MMNCIAPHEIQEGDLMAYVEGQAPVRIQEHVAQCPACAAEAQTLARASRSLLASLYRVSCPATEVLAQYQTKLLPARERKQVARHVKTCPHCMAELRQLAVADLPVPVAAPRIPDIARAVIEAVLMPPRTEWAMAARGGKRRQQLYQAGDLEIIVGVEPAANRWRLRGRVIRQGRTADEMIGQPVYLARQGQIASVELVDETGYFVFGDVESGIYELWIAHPEADVVVRDCRLGWPPGVGIGIDA